MEKKLKIYFLNIYQGSVNRGAERFVEELSKRLSKDFGVQVISGNKKEAKRWPILWRFNLDPSGIRVCLFTLKNISKILKEKPDIVIPLNGGWMSFWIRLATWAYGGKMIIAGQSGIGWDDRVNLWSFPNRFIALTKKAKIWSRRVNPLVKTVIIPNGVDVNKFGKDIKPIKVNLSKPIILGVGELDSWKRWYLTIKAVSNLKKGSLLLVGRGKKKKALQKMGENLLSGRFLIKSCSLDEMPHVFPAADVFTYPTTPEESFGIVLVEAMSSGLPVVATNDPIREEIVGDAGILMDPTNTEEYSNAIQKALKSNWKDKPRKQAEKFSWDIIAVNYKKLFKSLY